MKLKQIATMLIAVSLAAPSLLAFAQAAASRTIEASASIKPAAPKTGENTMEVTFMEGAKPVAGLKMTSSVGMTNMDMGTSHPAVKETSPGHYVLRPMFLMDGPWRVTLASANPKFTVSFDMAAGAKKPWAPVKQVIKLAGTAPAQPEPPKTEPPKTEPPKTEPPKTDPQKTEPAKQEPAKQTSDYGMSKTMSMPQLREKTSYNWHETMDFETRSGFGKLEPMIRMMILMMVGGSGMEGMKMAPMEMKFDETNFMEGGEDPMKGMPDMPSGEKPLKVQAVIAKATVGDNNVTITITTPDGKPVEKAKLATLVAMTSMDMGTTKPPVRELGKGKYAFKANFSMAGPWRLTLTVTPAGGKPSTYTFDFEAK